MPVRRWLGSWSKKFLVTRFAHRRSLFSLLSAEPIHTAALPKDGPHPSIATVQFQPELSVWLANTGGFRAESDIHRTSSDSAAAWRTCIRRLHARKASQTSLSISRQHPCSHSASSRSEVASTLCFACRAGRPLARSVNMANGQSQAVTRKWGRTPIDQSSRGWIWESSCAVLTARPLINLSYIPRSPMTSTSNPRIDSER